MFNKFLALNSFKLSSIILLIFFLTFLAACNGEEEEEGSATMMPGEACLSCHSSGSGSEASEKAFSAAGTVFSNSSGSEGVSVATVKLEDNTGYTVELTTNSAGNFYTSASLTFPVTITITKGADTVNMSSTPSSGDCNDCHNGQDRAFIHIP